MGNRPSIRQARRRLAEDGPPRERGPGDFAAVALPAADADVLADVLSGAESVLEIGLGYGSSALAIAEALADKRGTRHVIIDPHQALFNRVGVEVLLTGGLDGCYELIEEESQLALPRLVAEGESFDAAFVDGSHKFHNVFVDLFYLSRLVVPGGMLVLDDCGWASVATAVDYYVQNMGWTQQEQLLIASRLRAFHLPKPPADPPFDEFHPFGAGRAGFS